jgi:osmotically-inducible protein OsmY
MIRVGLRSTFNEEGIMLETKLSRKAHVLVLAVAALASIVMSLESCNTSQTPDQQVKDSQITTEVKAKLASKVGASSLTNIEANTTNGVVTLTGQVENADEKRSAEQVAAAVSSVVRVNNNLQVTAAPTPASQ